MYTTCLRTKSSRRKLRVFSPSCQPFLVGGFIIPKPAKAVKEEANLQRGGHDGLDGVHPVFRLVKDDGLGALEHLVGDLHAG